MPRRPFELMTDVSRAVATLFALGHECTAERRAHPGFTGTGVCAAAPTADDAVTSL
jgi:hypothetical protein